MLRVTDSDNALATATRSILVLEGYTAADGGAHTGAIPLADAGEDRFVHAGELVQLDGSGGDAGRAISFTWRQLEGPVVPLADGNTAKPSFMAPRADGPVTLRFGLRIFDGYFESDEAVVTVQVLGPGASLARAYAGADQTVQPGAVVRLDGAASGFPEGTALTYTWRQLGGPHAGIASSGSSVTFMAPERGTIEVQLTVRGGGLAANDTVVVTVAGDGPKGFRVARGAGSLRDLVLFEPIVAGNQFVWDFGDGSARSAEAAPMHRYTQSGTYTVRLEVLQPDGRTAVYTDEVRILVESRAVTADVREAPGVPLAFLVAGLLALLAARRRPNA